jgi:NAD(P)H-dependent FMN reductase/ribosomal protein S18 acetylase RimI-like enzyme
MQLQDTAPTEPESHLNSVDAIRVLAISGSLRDASTNSALVRAASVLAPPGVQVAIYGDLDQVPPFNPDLDTDTPPMPVAAFRTALKSADAVLLSSPEYAHGVPGALKNALDWVVGSGELVDKPVALLNASSRATRAWSSLVETLSVMSARVFREASITIPLNGTGLDATGIASDPNLAASVRSALRRLARQSARMKEYSIVPARPEHLSEIPNIELAAARLLCGEAPESVLRETTTDSVLEAAVGQGHLWVALAGKAPVGFAHVEIIDASTAHLEEIDVLPAHGRRGLGTRLVTEVCEWAASAGYQSVTLTTFRDVPWNRRFYERLGFRVVPDAELSAALRAIVDDETRRGLDPSRRVAMDWQCGPTLNVCEEAAHEDLQFLEEHINEFNFATTGIRDARGLIILLRGADRTIHAGLSGHTWGGVAEIRFLWVDEARRHTGIGSRLLRAAEHEARARGCRKMVLSTHSFQAPGFYGKHDFVVTGEFSEYPRGHRSMFLEKILS